MSDKLTSAKAWLDERIEDIGEDIEYGHLVIDHEDYEMLKAIRRRLDEGKPKVSRAWVDEKIQYLAEHPSHHRLEMVLRAAGVEVEE